MILRKICLIGEIAVGKTSLIRRYVDRGFSETYLSTVGVTISRKNIQVPARDGGLQDLQLILWDLEGGPRLKAYSSAYLRGAHGAVVVGDITRTDSVDAIGGYVEQFRAVNPGAPVFAALNKMDLRPAAPRDASRGGNVPAALTAVHTSAKTGEGVDHLFELMALRLAQGAPHGSVR